VIPSADLREPVDAAGRFAIGSSASGDACQSRGPLVEALATVAA
jgi:hypothetical protein